MAYFDEQRCKIILEEEDREIIKECNEHTNQHNKKKKIKNNFNK